MSEEAIIEADGFTEEEAPVAPDESTEVEGPKHPLQKLMDNPWALLVLGMVIPILSYTVWGWVELLKVVPAQLP